MGYAMLRTPWAALQMLRSCRGYPWWCGRDHRVSGIQLGLAAGKEAAFTLAYACLYPPLSVTELYVCRLLTGSIPLYWKTESPGFPALLILVHSPGSSFLRLRMNGAALPKAIQRLLPALKIKTRLSP